MFERVLMFTLSLTGRRYFSGVQSGRRVSRRLFNTTSSSMSGKSIQELLEKFKDPTSHFHIPPGRTGPATEDDHSTSSLPPGLVSHLPQNHSPYLSPSPEESVSSIQAKKPSRSDAVHHATRSGVYDMEKSESDARTYFLKNGFGGGEEGRLKWPVAWGDCDMFQHVNNVTFVRWFESARIRYSESLATSLPDGMMDNMLLGKGIGFILRDITVHYRAPITYPDTVYIATRSHEVDLEKSRFKLSHALWSLKNNRLSATAEGTMVAYDYDRLTKAPIPTALADILLNESQKSLVP
ncbi:hypothetical protein M231_05336 [Tremella mesenterica]|uniref:Thioesterase n=1 Tax=Tremella mesenterica TaxID=5217 RepID=A0A4Q1BI87_TREME|nr:hypothetical protein M231_05336 [Tremella mesenterica]